MFICTYICLRSMIGGGSDEETKQSLFWARKETNQDSHWIESSWKMLTLSMLNCFRKMKIYFVFFFTSHDISRVHGVTSRSKYSQAWFTDVCERRRCPHCGFWDLHRRQLQCHRLVSIGLSVRYETCGMNYLSIYQTSTVQPLTSGVPFTNMVQL